MNIEVNIYLRSEIWKSLFSQDFSKKNIYLKIRPEQNLHQLELGLDHSDESDNNRE